MIIYYLFIFNIILYLLFKIYIKIKYPFWNIQPVINIYSLFYKFNRNSYIIDNEPPKMNKYCNLLSIKTTTHDETSLIDRQLMVNFLNTHYLRSENVNYIPSLESFNSQFSNHSFPSYLSVYRQPKLIINYESQKYINSDEIIGLITSRPIYVTINGSKLTVNYIDYMCIHESYRKKGIAEQLIQTHNFNQCNNNKKINISLFKHEDMNTFIRPIVEYYTYAYKKTKVYKLNAQYKVVLITPQSFDILFHFIKQNKAKFDFTAMSHTSNIIELIKNKVLFIYILKRNDDIYGCYFFRNTFTTYDNKPSFELFSSISKCSEHLFYYGFTNAYYLVAKTLNTRTILIENISDNNIVINNIIDPLYFKSHTSLFFYNYASKNVSADKSFVLL
jgi:hypothetical protein